MANRVRGILGGALLLGASIVFGQVTPQLILRNPMPAQLSVWEQDRTVAQLVVTNAGQASFQNVRVSFTIRDATTNTVVANSVDNDPSMPRFTIPATSSVVRYGPDILEMKSTHIDASFQTKATTTNSLPEGDYEFCVTLLAQDGTVIGANGKVCKSFTVVIPDPPSLINPQNASVLQNQIAPTFTWTPVILAGGLQPKYQLTIAPIFGTQSAHDAVNTNTPLFQQTTPITSVYYGPQNAPFSFYPQAKSYAWQVQAQNSDGSPATRNTGMSEIFTFTPDTTHAKDSVLAKDTSQVAAGPCSDNCATTLPADKNPGAAVLVGDHLHIGKFDLVVTTLTSPSSSNAIGTGTVQVPFLKAPIMVQFSGLQVNAARQVYAGSASAIQDNSSPIPQGLANQGGAALGLDSARIRQIYQFASQTARLVGALTTSTPIGLPVGFENTFDGDHFVIAVIGMTFTGTEAKLNAVTVFEMPDMGPGVGISLGARDICFHPGGIGGGRGTLYLVDDLGYRNPSSWSFLFKAMSLPADSGTYVSWDCKGFQELHIKAEVEFPRDWLLPDPDDGVSLVKAKFVTSIKKQGDWLAAANLAKCTVAGANGFGLQVTEMYFDHSDLRNPPGIIFPASYAGTKGPDWTGFYLKLAQITLPKSLQTFDKSAPTISANNMLIDKTGLTGRFVAMNVIQYPKGNFGDWGASIDSIAADFVSSSLQKGEMAGRIQLPISDGPLVYQALLLRPKGPNKPLGFEFHIVPTDSLKANLWFATLTLDKTSRIEMSDTSGKFLASASLDGHLWISGDIGKMTSKIPGVSFKGIKFEGFKLMSKSPYLDTGTWSLASDQHGMAGFPVSLSDIKPVFRMNGMDVGIGLRFTLALNLHGEGKGDGIAGTTTLSIWGKMPLTGIPQQFAFDDVELDTISVHASISGITVDGVLALYRSDPTYGSGFRGSLSASFVKVFNGKATAQFGSVNGYRYWYVDAMITLVAGIPFGNTGVALYGFAGGAWYHMSRNSPSVDLHGSPNSGSDPNTAPAKNDPTPGTTNTGVSYSPDVSVAIGLKAGVTLGTFPSPTMLNADIILSVQFLNSGAVGLIALDGDAFFVSPGIDMRKDALVLATASIQYDFVKKMLDANLSFHTSDKFKAIYYSSGWMNFHVDSDNWHLLIGTPKNRIKTTLLSLATTDSYLMAGTDIPAPDFNDFEHRAEIETAIGEKLPTVRTPFAGGSTEGLAFGASQSYDTGDLRFLIFFGRFNLGYGFDVAIAHDPTRLCDNTGSAPGINGWYAMGQLYAYINFKIGLHVDIGFYDDDFTILDMGAGARCVLMLPNPIWVQGTVGGHYNILGGLVSGHCAFTFEVGSHCVVSTENPLAGVDLISDLKPADAETNVSVFALPTAAMNFAVETPVEFQYVDGNGVARARTFKVSVGNFTLTQTSNGQAIPGSWKAAPDGYTVGYSADDAFPEYGKLTATVSAYGMEYIGGKWDLAKKRNGTNVQQTRFVTFTAGKRPDVIVANNVLYSSPIHRQKFYLQQENTSGTLGTRASGYLFAEPGKYLARFLPLGGGTSQDVSASYDYGSQAVRFNVPPLVNEKSYALQVIRQTPSMLLSGGGMKVLLKVSQEPTVKNMLASKGVVGPNVSSNTTVQSRKLAGTEVRANEKLLYVYYFGTSKYNTLADKVNQLQFVKTDASTYWGTRESVTANFTTQETWDTFDLNGYSVLDRYRQASQMGPLIHVDAHLVEEGWYKNFAWPTVYKHILDLKLRRLWDENTALEDKFFLLFGMVNFNTTAYYSNKSSGSLFINEIDGGTMIGGLGRLSSGHVLGLGASQPTISVRYLHGEQVPGDYFSLWWRSHMLMLKYSQGEYNDESSEIYGQDGWIEANMSWLNYFASLDIQAQQQAYKPMASDYYTLYFIYGPKLTWDASGPWVKKKFTYGNPPKVILKKSAVSTGVVKAATTTTTTKAAVTTTPKAAVTTKKSLKPAGH